MWNALHFTSKYFWIYTFCLHWTYISSCNLKFGFNGFSFYNITHLFHLSWSSSKCIQERAKSIHMMFEQILLSRVTISDPWLTTKFRGAWVVLWHQPTTKQVRWVGWPHMEDVSLHKDESVLTTIAVLAPHFSTNMLWHSSLLTSQCCVSSISKLL